MTFSHTGGYLAAAALSLAACGPTDPLIAAGAAAGSVVIFQRAPTDFLVSLAMGRDCSIVYLDKGEKYCRPKEQPPAIPVFCTRSLGTPDCWADPAKLPNRPRDIADGPRVLTPEQESDRTRWRISLW